MDPVVTSSVAVALGLLTTMVIGATEFVRRLFDRDFRAAAIIFVSAMVGGVSGVVLFDGVGFALGLVTGLSASGVITGLQKFGSGTTSTPTKLSDRG